MGFFKAGALLFGGGYIMIPLIQEEVVEQYGWLTEQEFLDGLALGQATPGPIVITATFVGYAAAEWWGAILATVVIFLPAFVFVLFVTGPFMDRFRTSENVRAFLKGAGAAVVGAILAAAVLLFDDAVVDAWTLALFAAALGAVWLLKVELALVILSAGVLGLVLAPL